MTEADKKDESDAPKLSAQLKHLLQQASASDNLDQALANTSFELAKIFSARLVMIFFTANTQGEYKLVSNTQLNNNTPLPNDISIHFGDGLIGEVGDRAEIINVNEVNNDNPISSNPELSHQNFGAFIGLPLIEQAKLLGIISLQRSSESPFSENEQATLMTFTTQLADIINSSHDKQSIIDPSSYKGKTKQRDKVLQGISGSPGITLGKAIVVYPEADLDAVPDRQSDSPEQEWLLMREAIAKARHSFKMIHKQAQESLPPAEQALFEVYIQMLESRSLTNEIKQEIIEEQQWAQGALRRVIDRHIRHMKQFDDEYLQQRTDDLRDLGNRILAKLQQKEQQEPQKRPKNFILVSEDVTATCLLEANPSSIGGVISGSGSSNSHVAILARALGIPAVMGIKDIPLNKLDQNQLAVDGYTGQVYLSPSRNTKTEFRELAEEERAFDQELTSLANVPCISKPQAEGKQRRVHLLVNTGLATDIKSSLEVGAEGVGLFRTEIPFMTRERFPSEEEQCQIYRETLAAFAPHPVTMRTLDIGGDKALPYFQIKEENPFLGWRGIRVTLDHPEIFLQQIRAMLTASIGLDNLSIMLPMISTVREAESAIELIHQAYLELREEKPDTPPVFPKLGLMIEVPAAVYQTYELASRVDFVSVGSNDLIQYLLAVDRNNPRVASLYDSMHPALLHALKFTVDAAHRAKRKASICGELAADPLAAVLLLGMGYDSLSMNARSLPRIKWILRQTTLEQAQTLTKEVLAIDDPIEIRCHMEMALDEMGLGGLIRAGRD